MSKFQKHSYIIFLFILFTFKTIYADYAERKDFPAVLSIKERAEIVNNITQMRLDQLLPQIMREEGFDMWIIICTEDNLDPVFKTMIPYDSWCPITQILVFYDQGPGKGVESLNLSRTNMKGLHKNAWDYRAWDKERKESQWDCLARVVNERNPAKIGINESEVIWAANNLTVTLKKKLINTIGLKYARRLHSAEKLATLWLETLLDEELNLYERAVAISHALIAETFSNKVITPGVTTTDDLLYYYLQRAANLGIQKYAWPWVKIRGRDPKILKKYGMNDKTIRRGDLIQCDVGIIYLRYYTDHAEWGYVLRAGETDVPAGYKKVMTEGNKLQDIFCNEFKAGLTGNQLLSNILKRAHEEGISKPMIYSHSIGYYLHEPGPLIGLPWEQLNTGGRGDIKLVYNSTFTAELSVTCPVQEWGNRELTMALEQVVAFTKKGVYFLDGRQIKFHIVE